MEKSSKKCLLCFLAVIDVVTATRIRGGPSNVAAAVGTGVQLQCLTDDGSCENVNWFGIDDLENTVQLTQGSRVPSSFGDKYNVASNCSLTVNRIEMSDARQYDCIVFDTLEKKSAFLAVYDARGVQFTANATTATTTASVVAGDVVQFSCSLIFKSKIKFFNSLRMLGVQNKSLADESSSYRAEISTQVTAKHGVNMDSVDCVALFSPNVTDASFARNNVEVKSAIMEIKILYPPTVTYPDKSCTCSESLVKCTAEGSDPLKFKWIEINSKRRVSDTEFLNPNETTSSSRYQCIASNVLNGNPFEGRSIAINISTECCERTGPVSPAGTAAIGVIVGVVAIVIIGVIVAVICVKKRKKQQSSSPSNSGRESGAPVNSSQYSKSQISGPVPGSRELVPLKTQNNHAPDKDQAGNRDSEVVYAEIGEPPKPARGVPRKPEPSQENVYSHVKYA